MVNQNWGPYDRDSWNPVYGNQLFMKTRNGSMKAADNFLDPNKASSLLSSGFSPDFATVITMDRKATKQQTNIDVIYERVRDDYQLHWTSTNWKVPILKINGQIVLQKDIKSIGKRRNDKLMVMYTQIVT